MAMREFEDESGATWMAWDVPPYRVYEPVRSGEDRRRSPRLAHHPERRAPVERRRLSLSPAMELGWVCFQCGPEKRRLAPPPPGWDTCPDDELRELCRRSR